MLGRYLAPDPHDRSRSATRVIDGVICLAARPADMSFLGRALGFGTIADASPRLLERIERHYMRLGRPVRIALATGCVTAATVRMLERRGYVPVHDPVLVYVYDRPRPPAMPAIPGLTIERVDVRDAGLYARVAYEGFPERGADFPRIIERLIRARRRTLRTFLGRIDGEPAATGMLMDVRPVGGLMNGSVRPRFRGRGIQTALIAHRIHDGWARGERVFFGETGTPASAHNMEDLGWRKLFDEMTWERSS